MAPTIGFGLVRPRAFSASRSALRMYFSSRDFISRFGLPGLYPPQYSRSRVNCEASYGGPLSAEKNAPWKPRGISSYRSRIRLFNGRSSAKARSRPLHLPQMGRAASRDDRLSLSDVPPGALRIPVAVVFLEHPIHLSRR